MKKKVCSTYGTGGLGRCPVLLPNRDRSSQFFGGGGSSGFNASDPGVRGDPAGAGGQLPGLSPNQAAFFAPAWLISIRRKRSTKASDRG